MNLKESVKEEWESFMEELASSQDFDPPDMERAFNAGYQAALNRIINETDLKYRILSNQVEE